ncbi:UDP-glucuronic acid decarboxylase family protein [Parasedimentitalea psychrophila]|uniref:UDP-glucuronate decarboxylase n=1 Tax=Parasedimentitalea psychrophila TaxID=2997337 RepID=A0A9Y2P3B2_9RHOB|nr:UDP-glucuronic acid decarboxylase family protein [Parasedimentitalea psychrophila]WIY27496.1 SDR family oxidoreductase [Parasedimentitalea psychrophila]
MTGGCGFIGSHLIDRLIEAGHEVLCVDNLLTGNKQNVEHLLGHPRFEYLCHDVTNPLHVEVDEIYNLACPASPAKYQRDPLHTMKTLVLGAINILDLAKRLDIKVLQASTSEIYGDPKEHPQRESYWGHVNPLGPRACYDEGKRCAETLFMDYHRQLNVQIKIARIFNTYGPRMSIDDGRVVSSFVLQALQNEDISIFGDGSQTRSFCYVEDMVTALIDLMGTGPEVTGPVNLGMPHEIPVVELAQQILTKVGSQSKIAFRPLPVDDPRQRLPDISLAREILDWQPQVSLKDGLDRTITYYRGRLIDAA